MIRNAAGALAVTAALAMAAPAWAHPHGWIDLSVEVLFDGDGRVSGLRQTWLFDEFYTAFATEGFDGDGDGAPDQDKLVELLHENLGSLGEADYFTRIESGGAVLALGAAAEASTRMRAGRLEATFLVPLKEPVAVGPGGFVYAVYDPTYYVEILHAETPDPVRLSGAPADCRPRLIAPAPEPQAVMLAQALDRTQSAGDGLGVHFAEKVEIRCGS